MNKKIMLFGLVFMMLLFTNVAMAVAPVHSNEFPVDDGTSWDCPSATFNITLKDKDSGSVNWTIETRPDVGTASGNEEANGSKECALTGMLYTTTYWVWVNATGNTSQGASESTNSSYNFTTRDAKLRENPALSLVEKTIVGVIGIIVLLGFLYIVMKTKMTDLNIAKLLVGLIVALALLTVMFTML